MRGAAAATLAIVVGCGHASREVIAPARRYAVAQQVGAAELGVALGIGEAAATAQGCSAACVVFDASGPFEARIGVLERRTASGWEAWHLRVGRGTQLDCDAMTRRNGSSRPT